MRRVVIGVGNRLRGDDGVGPRVADLVRLRAPAGVDVVECDGEPLRLLDALMGADRCVVVDAARVEPPGPGRWSRPGRVVRLEPGAGARRGGRAASTHGLGVEAAIRLAGALERVPAELVVYGVEGEDFGPGHGLSPKVAAALPLIAARVLRQVVR